MGLAFAIFGPRGDCDRHATRWKNGGVLCAVLLGWLLPTAVTAAGLSSEGNTDGVLTWQLGRIEPGRSTVRTVLFAYADSLEEVTAVVEAAKGKAKGLGRSRGFAMLQPASGSNGPALSRPSGTAPHLAGICISSTGTSATMMGRKKLQACRYGQTRGGARAAVATSLKTCASSVPCRVTTTKQRPLWKQPTGNCAS
jgi:hypothetical protein